MRQPVGWKIGFNTPAIQEHFGLTDAVVGYMTDTGVSADGATVSLAGWGAPAVEVEVAVRVGDDGAVAGLAPALELVDLDISFDDIEPVLAGNICHRGVIFGDEVPGVDPWAMVATVTKAGDVVAEGVLDRGPGGDPAVRALLPGGPRRGAPTGRPDHRRLRGGPGRRRSRATSSTSRSGRSGGCRSASTPEPAGSPAERSGSRQRHDDRSGPSLPASPTASHVLAVGHAMPSSATGVPATVLQRPRNASGDAQKDTVCRGRRIGQQTHSCRRRRSRWLPGATRHGLQEQRGGVGDPHQPSRLPAVHGEHDRLGRVLSLDVMDAAADHDTAARQSGRRWH